MKKLLFFVVAIVVGYLVYNNFIKEKEAAEINASYISSREAVDIDAPTVSPREYAHYEGTVKNISGKNLTNLVITYLIDAQESNYKVSKLAPDEVINFKTEPVMLHHMDPEHYLKSVVYDSN